MHQVVRGLAVCSAVAVLVASVATAVPYFGAPRPAGDQAAANCQALVRQYLRTASTGTWPPSAYVPSTCGVVIARPEPVTVAGCFLRLRHELTVMALSWLPVAGGSGQGSTATVWNGSLPTLFGDIAVGSCAVN